MAATHWVFMPLGRQRGGSAIGDAIPGWAGWGPICISQDAEVIK